jgi:hypothetical protein
MIDPQHPTASTIYVSRVIDPHPPTASTIYISRVDRSTPSNCIYHLHFMCGSIHTIQLHLPFTFHVWIDPHRPTASTIYIAPDPSTPSKLHLPFCMAPGQSTPSKCINCLSRTWIDRSTPSNCKLSCFCIVLHPNRG